MSKIKISAYTDAAAFNNGKKDPKLPEHSCSAAVLVYEDEVIYATSYHNPNTSISYGELFAIYMILTDFSKMAKNMPDNRYKLTLYSDSAYCVQSLTSWIKSWKKQIVNGIWQNSTGAVAYQEMMTIIDDIINDDSFDITIRHIKGHIDVSKPADIAKAMKTWKNINKCKVTEQDICKHVFYNNVCDNYARKSLKKAMGGKDNDRVRKKFKKYIDPVFK